MCACDLGGGDLHLVRVTKGCCFTVCHSSSYPTTSHRWPRNLTPHTQDSFTLDTIVNKDFIQENRKTSKKHLVSKYNMYIQSSWVSIKCIILRI